MSAAIANRETVFQAARTIEESGKKATSSAVRTLLGGGSQATIIKYLQEYQYTPRDTADDVPASETLRSIFEQFQRSLLRTVRAEAETEFSLLKSALGAQRQREAEEVMTQAQEIDRLAMDVEQTTQRLSEAHEHIRHQAELLASEKDRSRELETRLREYQARLTSMDQDASARIGTVSPHDVIAQLQSIKEFLESRENPNRAPHKQRLCSEAVDARQIDIEDYDAYGRLMQLDQQ